MLQNIVVSLYSEDDLLPMTYSYYQERSTNCVEGQGSSLLLVFFVGPIQRKDILHLTARKTGIHNMPKSGRRKGRPQGCSLSSHRLRRLKPLTPTFSPAVCSAISSMLHRCTSDLNRRRTSWRERIVTTGRLAVHDRLAGCCRGSPRPSSCPF